MQHLTTGHTSGGRKASLGRRHILLPQSLQQNVLYARARCLQLLTNKRKPRKERNKSGIFKKWDYWFL